MRIIAGNYKGQTLKTLKGVSSRPTLSRIRESLFNIIKPHIREAGFADVYAGCGSMGLEALSRGAGQVAFIESDCAVIRILRKNIEKFDPDYTRTSVFAGDALRILKNISRKGPAFDILFVDPPYGQETIDSWDKHLHLPALVRANGRVILQHDRKSAVPKPWAGCAWLQTRTYGRTCLSFFKKGGNINA
jgi:16S rRNA (guanine966-N2)-methyltransferase